MRKRTARSRLGYLVLVGALGLVGACGGEGSDPVNPIDPIKPPPATGDVVRSQKSRLSVANVPAAEVLRLSEDNAAFAWSLYHQLKSDPGNLFYSPLSISQALAMTYAGAQGQTAVEMEKTLHFSQGQAGLHSAMNALDQALATRGSGAKGIDGKGFRLHVVNATWGQKGYGFVADYLDVLSQYYGAGIRLLDFFNAPDASRLTINKWVETETEQKIKDLLPEDAINGGTRLVLTNAVYFNAAWQSVFPEASSGKSSFHLLDGKSESVDTMHQTFTYPYLAGKGYQAVELPYDGKELSMVVVVPDAGSFATVEQSIGPALMAEVTKGLTKTTISLTLPKWKTEAKFSLKDTLKAMGMTESFDNIKANFKGINGGIEALWIDDVIHQAFVAVNEKGTEAAAATAVIMAGGMPQVPILTVDRPFIYVIRDNATGSIVFVGRLLNPLG